MPFSETVKYIEMKKEKNKTYFRHFIIERKLDGPTHPIYIYIHICDTKWKNVRDCRPPLRTFMIRFAPFHAFLSLRLFRGVVNGARPPEESESWGERVKSKQWKVASVPGCGMAIWKFLPSASSADFHLANAATSVDNRKQLSWS